MKTILAVLAAMLCGCSSIQNGALSLRTFGTDIGEGSWAKKNVDGSAEVISFKGANGSDSAHTAANLVMGVIGALVGLPAGQPELGAAIGFGGAEGWQTLKDIFLKPAAPATVPATPPVIPAPLPVTGALVDAPYTPEYMAANADSEECGLERETGMSVRIECWSPSYGWWIISSVGRGHIANVNGKPVFTPYVKDGISYNLRGYTDQEPQSNDPNPSCGPEPKKYVLIDCRKVK